MTDDFFGRWKEKYGIETFVKDGIVCPDKYESILYILKDPNNANLGDDLRESLGTRTDEGRTWFNVARWTTALLDGGEFSEKASKMNSDMQHEQMRRVAVVNLKKEAGKGSAEDQTIRQCAKQQKGELLEEIRQCKPKLIVVCGTGMLPAVESILGRVKIANDGPKMEAVKSATIGTVCIDDKDIPIVGYRHPSHGCLAEKSFHDMKRIKEFFNL
ncbi:MAG: hypothetical protein ACI39H_00130 [Lachnospiraceae bacterium]